MNGYEFFFDRDACAARIWFFFYALSLAMFDEIEKPDYHHYHLFYIPVEFIA